MLQDLVKHGTLVEIESLLQQNHFSPDQFYESLKAAFERCDLSIVRLLLQHGADPNYIDPLGWPLLFSAVEHEEAEQIELLVQYGANINQHDESGWTPLMQAIDIEGDGANQMQRQPTAVITKLLLSLGADPAHCDASGRTALDLAIAYDHQEAVKLLKAVSSKSPGSLG